MTPDLTAPLDADHDVSAAAVHDVSAAAVHDVSAAAVRIVRQSFVDARERAARWEPAPAPELTEAIERLTAMERGET